MPALILLLLTIYVALLPAARAQAPGFLSIDCGGTENYSDDLGLVWTADTLLSSGSPASISAINKKQYKTLRYFPADDRKYCYTLNVTTRTRYLIRANFLYGNFDNSNAFPKFDLYVGATYWSTIVIDDGSAIVTKEMIMLASSPSISVCLSNASTGNPFISTLELRQLNGSLYYTEHESESFLSLSARINFGAFSPDPVRYPDDPYDRIWESDSVKKANYLVDAAPGTTNVSTSMPIDVSKDERPPQKVMQTAVVGQNGELSYRLNLYGFPENAPANAWAFSYFAEIEELATDETRKFKLFIPGLPDVSKPTVNIEENAPGKYKLYEPGYYNIPLPFIFSFAFRKTNDSTRGPILNAFEIYKYIKIDIGSPDAPAMGEFLSHFSNANWAEEGGDPCLPSPWSWVQCNSDLQPKIISLKLSNKNLTGSIPKEITMLTSLVELWLDNNNLTGFIPDLSGCSNLKVIHFENNQLTGSLPLSLINLPNLRELYLQNNMLSDNIPEGLLHSDLVYNFSGNANLHVGRISRNYLIIVIGCAVGVFFLLASIVFTCVLLRKRKDISLHEDYPVKAIPLQKPSSCNSDLGAETAYRYNLYDLDEATNHFAKNIGSGGFGRVYYGKMKDGTEIAVKVLINDSFQGKKQFTNEVSLLSRIHHRHLVSLLGYCLQDGNNILVYEFMHNGTLKEHLRGRDKYISWIKRLEIAEDSAKGIEYLHTGCTPAIIHRDIKTSNILLDKRMRAKVSDFGLSKPAADESHVSSMVRGTLGYLDPEYYTSQQLTEKSDVYSFGIILLELISGREPISNTRFGEDFCNIGPWAKSFYESGDIEAIIDPAIAESYQDIQSIWKIAETAVRCIRPQSWNRPCITEVLKDIQDAIALEKSPLHSMPVETSVHSTFTDSFQYPELR